MSRMSPSLFAAAAAMALFSSGVSAQRAYGVNAAGTLFHFDLATPSAVTEVGNIGFLPEGLDFRPGTSTLYALDVGRFSAQLYTINIGNASATAVGAGFATIGVNYNLIGSQTFGFDFNPTTLQNDNSMRICLVSINGTNMRLNSATGGIAGVDSNLVFGDDSSARAFVDGAAYINNLPTAGGETALYDMDSRKDALLLQSPPNAGILTTLGQFGVTVNAQQNIGFDIYTAPGSSDPTNADDAGWAVLKRPDAPINGPFGAYLLYRVNLNTGQITNGALVGPADAPYDFVGGFAINPIPEPGTYALMTLGLAGLLLRHRKSGSA